MSDSLVRVSRRVGPLRRRHDPGGAFSGEKGRPVNPRRGARGATTVPEGSGVPAGRARVDRARYGGRVHRSEDRTVRLLPTISRTISLSFQSSFHLSLTVLVRYRSRANI